MARWTEYETKKMEIRSGKSRVYIPRLIPVLENLLQRRYSGNLQALCIDFLPYANQTSPLSEKNACFEAIMQEFGVYSLYFSLCEEQFMICRVWLKDSVNEMWNWWQHSMEQAFQAEVVQNYFELHKTVYPVYPLFIEFTEELSRSISYLRKGGETNERAEVSTGESDSKRKAYRAPDQGAI